MQFCRGTVLRMIGSALFGVPAICAHNQVNEKKFNMETKSLRTEKG